MVKRMKKIIAAAALAALASSSANAALSVAVNQTPLPGGLYGNAPFQVAVPGDHVRYQVQLNSTDLIAGLDVDITALAMFQTNFVGFAPNNHLIDQIPATVSFFGLTPDLDSHFNIPSTAFSVLLQDQGTTNNLEDSSTLLRLRGVLAAPSLSINLANIVLPVGQTATIVVKPSRPGGIELPSQTFQIGAPPPPVIDPTRVAANDGRAVLDTIEGDNGFDESVHLDGAVQGSVRILDWANIANYNLYLDLSLTGDSTLADVLALINNQLAADGLGGRAHAEALPGGLNNPAGYDVAVVYNGQPTGQAPGTPVIFQWDFEGLNGVGMNHVAVPVPPAFLAGAGILAALGIARRRKA